MTRAAQEASGGEETPSGGRPSHCSLWSDAIQFSYPRTRARPPGHLLLAPCSAKTSIARPRGRARAQGIRFHNGAHHMRRAVCVSVGSPIQFFEAGWCVILVTGDGIACTRPADLSVFPPRRTCVWWTNVTYPTR
jgi:hypothetical protein